MKRAEIRIPNPETGTGGLILIDGEHLRGVTGFTVTHNFGDRRISRLVVDLVVYPIEVFGQAEVLVPEKTRESLIRLGWTPPPVGVDDETEDVR